MANFEATVTIKLKDYEALRKLEQSLKENTTQQKVFSYNYSSSGLMVMGENETISELIKTVAYKSDEASRLRAENSEYRLQLDKYKK